MVSRLPFGAQRILDMRLKGEKPKDMVIVSLVGQLDEGNPVVMADSADYDWRFCRGLEVCIFGKVGAPNRQVALAIGAILPKRLYLWDVESKEGTDLIVHLKENALRKHRAELKPSDWTAILWPWDGWQNKEFEGKGREAVAY